MTQSVTLAALKSEGLVQAVYGDETVRVSGVAHDSRRVQAGDLFVAIPGLHHDGAEFVAEAAAKGASAVLAVRSIQASIPVVVAEDLWAAFSRIASRVYGDPSVGLTAVGVTGTNGKTTITYLLEAMLQAVGATPAVIGTVNFRGPRGALPASHTTPLADDLMRLTQKFVEQGVTHLVMEVSSHALATYRADGIRFRVAAFTNLTQDHLDFHGDMIQYGQTKRRLFEKLNPGCAVINIDDAFGAQLAGRLKIPVFRCSRQPTAKADIHAISWSCGPRGIEAKVNTPAGLRELNSPLLGAYNLDNLLIALGCGVALELDLDRTLAALSKAAGAPGRLERVDDPRDVLVAVDYAHTPDALDNVLATLRPLTKGRLWVVFGCGGDRDPDKRRVMGQIAADRASVTILTSDNPRSESPLHILEQIESGVQQRGLARIKESDLVSCPRGYLVEPDRRRAIAMAVRYAVPGDTVLIAGKGHETVQIIGDQRNPFDDRIEARKAIDDALAHR
jgi:UDP-N-acetylmuramoyl-L-alanyl-D-glutamate--2,6-diaminopimelate ligase